MAEAASIGVLPDAALDMTPRELRACFKGAAIAHKREHKMAMFLAWQTVEFMPKPKKFRLPDLKTIFMRMDRKPMSARQLRNALLGWHKSVGGTTQVVPKGTITRSH